ncbi:hypothetical protein O5404_07745 (plasmid) [Borrelia miyamotoi]|uniref:Uncharacterized protein n=1 Tax=Borrelia miyamotoi TaxID=47466 RepID=A0AAX3JPQ4_9SPIR|nr:hypothetical protein [Borrelia miyamotoi]WAZ72896.1 hypothetical protein O5404_07745 [Borrelia miyamotoi]
MISIKNIFTKSNSKKIVTKISNTKSSNATIEFNPQNYLFLSIL